MVAHAGAKGSEHPLVLEENEEDRTTPSEISSVTPLPDVISLLTQHGCQNITQMLDLSACSEYPISSGGFGDIFRGKLNDNASVAIKCIRIVIDPYSDEPEKYLKCAAREIHTWSKLDHRYVSKLLGLAQFRGRIAMVSPWAEHGALPRFLERRPQQNRLRLWVFNRYSMAHTMTTPEIKAPELLDGAPCSVETDSYALGMTILVRQHPKPALF
ncbi:hypothetical protein FRC09_011281 [Ceratobasidium sp. 395]|nr:hypothetical protein FRC09_011281 [Ceratobasidium sp. 395]